MPGAAWLERDRDDADSGRPQQAGADQVPRSGAGAQDPPPNTLGLHRVMFAVDDIQDTVARLRAHGAELLGEVAQYENIFLLCYLRGPAGIIVALAEQLG
jgi:predicted enzyme related to lactoylglutathione lyase